MDSLRTFVAIEIPKDIRARVTEHIHRLRREAPDVRASWGREDNLHLTLKFLGNVSLADIPNVSEAVEHASKTTSRFEICISGCGSFPPQGRPKVLWIGVLSEPPAHSSPSGRGQGEGGEAIGPASSVGRQASSLQSLHQRIEDHLADAGLARESRAFNPHLTIARLRNAQGARGLAELHRHLGFSAEAFTVSEVVVFRSELLKEGSKHTPISRHRLQ